MKSASTPVVLPVAVKFKVFTALLAVRLAQDMPAGTPPEFSRAVTRESTAEIAAVAPVRFRFAPGITGQFCNGATQNMAPAQRCPGEDAPELPGRGACVSNYCEYFAGARVGIRHQIAPVQGACVPRAAEIPPIRLCFRITVTTKLGYGSREQVAPRQGRPGQDSSNLPGSGHTVANESKHFGVAGVGIVRKVSRVALGSREIVCRVEAVAGDGSIHFRSRVIWYQSVAYAGADLALRAILGDVQGIDCPGDHGVHLCLTIGLCPLVVI